MTQVAAFNPWRVLRGRDELTFGRRRLPDGVVGALVGTVVLVDDRLDPEERMAALTHELIHYERGVLPAAAPEHVVAKEERAVDDEVARRLVPWGQLDELYRRANVIGEQLMLWEIARIFGVTEAVAERAVRLWEAERALAQAVGPDDRLAEEGGEVG